MLVQSFEVFVVVPVLDFLSTFSLLGLWFGDFGGIPRLSAANVTHSCSLLLQLHSTVPRAHLIRLNHPNTSSLPPPPSPILFVLVVVVSRHRLTT